MAQDEEVIGRYREILDKEGFVEITLSRTKFRTLMMELRAREKNMHATGLYGTRREKRLNDLLEDLEDVESS